MSRLKIALMLGALTSVFVEPCSAQGVQNTPAPVAQPAPALGKVAPDPGVQAAPVPAPQVTPAANTPKEPRTSHTGHSRSDRYNHWHNTDYYTPSVGYYPYSVPYSYGYGGYGGYYPYRGVYSNYGYPINLSSGLERGFRYGNTYINPNFGN